MNTVAAAYTDNASEVNSSFKYYNCIKLLGFTGLQYKRCGVCISGWLKRIVGGMQSGSKCCSCSLQGRQSTGKCKPNSSYVMRQ
ncbi:hypothetical protein FKM82_024821 [Ascaphus truei]